jgi:Flp pilus assembly protein TadG
MRVIQPRLGEEKGAAATFVAVGLVIMLGMAALVIDEGWLIGSRRRIVQGTDASALAAAMSCGLREGQASADGVAVQYAQANEADAQIADGYPFYDPSCDAPSGAVTVEFTSEEPQFFAPAVDRPATGQVRWRATAVWGAATGASGVMPFMLSAGRLTDCEIPPPDPDYDPGTCHFAFNNGDIGNAQWGGMNLNQWNVSPTSGCSSAGTSQSISWIQNGSPFLSMNWPDPTYVCRDTGMAVPVWNELGSLAGQVRQFPVNDPTGISGTGHGQVDAGGALCPPPCSPHKYDIIGFAELRIISVLRGNQGGAEACPGLPSDPNSWCLTAEWVGFSTEAGSEPCVGCQNFGVVAVRLDA